MVTGLIGTCVSQPVYCNPMMLTASTSRLRCFKVNLDWFAIKILAIQAGNGSTGLMAFHFDKAKTLTLAGKNIRHQLGRTYRTEFGKQGLKVGFACVGRQITNK